MTDDVSENKDKLSLFQIRALFPKPEPGEHNRALEFWKFQQHYVEVLLKDFPELAHRYREAIRQDDDDWYLSEIHDISAKFFARASVDTELFPNPKIIALAFRWNEERILKSTDQESANSGSRDSDSSKVKITPLFTKTVIAEGGKEEITLPKSDLESIIADLSSNNDLVDLMLRYIDLCRTGERKISEEDEMRMRQKIFPYFDKKVGREYPKYSVFIWDISEEMFQRMEAGTLKVNR